MRRLTIGLTAAFAIACLGYAILAQPPGGGERPRPPLNPLTAALDADKDGELSAEEISAAAEALKTLDKNGNGKLDREEIRPQWRGPGRFGGPGPGGRGRPGPGGLPAASLGSPPQPKDEAEKKIIDVLDDMDRNQRRGMMNVPIPDGRLLRLLSEAVGAKHVVEVGTSNGYSAIWFCLALRTSGGKLTTFEIDARRASLARENFKRAGVDQIVTLVEGNAHETVKQLKEPIDVVFLDADKQGYVDYLEKLLPLVRPGGLVVAHNINPRMADPGYVKAITSNPELETVFYMQGAGVSVTLKKR